MPAREKPEESLTYVRGSEAGWGSVLAAPQSLFDGNVERRAHDAEALQSIGGGRGLAQDAEQEMIGVNVVVHAMIRLGFGQLQRLHNVEGASSKRRCIPTI